jgi:hypothetical protein
MAELERIKKADSAAKSLADIGNTMNSVVTSSIIPAIKAIDKGNLDDYVLKDGKWMMRGEDSEGEKD